MTPLEEFRKKYPEYNDLSDYELAKGLHLKYYSDIPFDEYARAIGLSLPGQRQKPTVSVETSQPTPEFKPSTLSYTPEGKVETPEERFQAFKEEVSGLGRDIGIGVKEGLKKTAEIPYGVGEAIGTLGQAVVSFPVSVAEGLKDLYMQVIHKLPRGESIDWAQTQQVMRETFEKFSPYRPRTETGEFLTGVGAAPFVAYTEVLSETAKRITDDPQKQKMIEVIGEMALLGLPVVTGKVKAGLRRALGREKALKAEKAITDIAQRFEQEVEKVKSEGLQKELERPPLPDGAKINAITKGEAVDRLAKGDKKVVKHIKEGVENKGAEVIADEVYNKALGKAVKEKTLDKFRKVESEVKKVIEEGISRDKEDIKGVYSDEFKRQEVGQAIQNQKGSRGEVGADRVFQEEKAPPEIASQFDKDVYGGKLLDSFRRALKRDKPEETAIEADNLVRRSQIAKELEEKLNIPVRIGKFREKAHGIYKVKPEVIRTKIANDIEVIAHEVGHHLNKILFGTDVKGRLNKEVFEAFKDELLPIATKPKKGQSKLPEGFAEFMRYYITDVQKAKEKAPRFYEFFDKTLQEKAPEIREVLLKAREDFDRWAEMPASSRILSHIAVDPDKPKVPVKDKLEEVYYKGVDDLHFLNVAVKLLSEGRELPYSENPFILARLTRGVWGKVDHFLERGTFDFRTYKVNGKSLKEILEPVKKRLDDFRVYIVSRRAIDLHKRGIETGIDIEDAKVSLKELDNPIFKKAFEDLQAYQDKLLKYLLDSGVISKEVYARMKELNPNYVPFYRVMEYEVNPLGTGGKRFANLFVPTKKIKGSGREIIDPLESIIKNTYTMLYIADKNNVMTKLVKLAEGKEGSGALIEKIPPPIKETKIHVDEVLSKLFDGLDKEILEGLPEAVSRDIISIFRPSSFIPKDEPIVMVFRNGKREYYRLHPDLYRSVMAIDREGANMIVRMLGIPARMLRLGATLPPEFWMRNAIRDNMMAFIQAKHGFVPAYDFVKGVFHALKKDDLYWMYKRSGAEHAMLVSLDREYLQKNLKDILSGMGIGDDVFGKTLIKHPIELLRVLSEFSEKGTRLGVFERALKAEEKGFAKNIFQRSKREYTKEDIIRAGFESREATLDFARMGAKTQAVNMLVAFWNARLQGLDKIIRTFKRDPVGATMKTVAIITVPEILLYLAQKDDPRYKELPAWQKDLFYIILTKDNIYRIPKPFELGVLFGSLPRRLLEYAEEQDPEALKDWARIFLESAQPGFIPTVAVPLIENFANWSMFLDRPIVPRALEGLEPELQAPPYTSETAKLLGKAVGYSPAKIENLIRGYTAGLGMYTVNLIDLALKTAKVVDVPPAPKMTLADMPAIRAFVVRYPTMNTKSIQRLYDYYAELQRATKTIRNMEKVKMPERKIRDYTAEHIIPLIFKDDITSMAEFLKTTRLQAQQVYQSREMTPEEKRQRLDEIYLNAIGQTQKIVGVLDYAKRIVSTAVKKIKPAIRKIENDPALSEQEKTRRVKELYGAILKEAMLKVQDDIREGKVKGITPLPQ